jgi:hypothetical protein
MKISRLIRCLLLPVLAAGLRAEEKPAGEPAKSAGWLVDAMAEKTGGSPDESKSSAVPGDPGPATKASLAGSKLENGAVNPLSPYLKAWITPRDFELLKTKGSGADPLGVATGAGLDTKMLGLLTPDVRANPYLADLLPGIPAGEKAPQSAPAAPLPAPVAPAAKNDAAPAKTPGPPADVLKSQDDAKYFPQLKHF